MTYTEVLNKNVGSHEKTNKILNLENYYGATNSQLLLMIPKSDIPEGINPDDLSVNPPDTSFIFKLSKREVPFEFSLSKLILAITKVPQIQDHDDCHNCDGYGTVECECCGNESKCNECGGTGEGKPISGQFSLNYSYTLKIDESYFPSSNIDNLISILIDLNVRPEDIIKMTSSDGVKPHMFEINNIIIVCMPTHYENVNEELLIKVC